jgi:hypothetical protein
MIKKRIHMTANNSYLHLKVGVGFPIHKLEEGFIREKAIRFYWELFGLLKKDPDLLKEDYQSRVLRLSFEDDFGADGYVDDDFDDDVFIPGEDLFREEDSLFEEEDPEPKGELFYK